MLVIRDTIKKETTELTALYGKGFDRSTLYKFVRFYKFFPQIVDSASPKLERLSWTHFRVLLQVNDEAAREWYAAEAATEAWSVKDGSHHDLAEKAKQLYEEIELFN